MNSSTSARVFGRKGPKAKKKAGPAVEVGLVDALGVTQGGLSSLVAPVEGGVAEVLEPAVFAAAVEAAQAAPVEAAPVEAAPVEAAPAAPVEAAPVEAAPVEVEAAPAAPVEAAPVEAAPVEVEAAPVEVAGAVLVEATPVEAAPTGGEEELLGAVALATEELLVEPGMDEVVSSPVNYDEPGLFEVELEEGLYRFDAGKQGTALCLSLRAPGSWRWGYLGELRWDGRDLRSRALERKLLGQLSIELRRFSRETAQ